MRPRNVVESAGSIKSTTEMIDRDTALRYLASAGPNRTLRRSVSRYYASMMECGGWLFNGQPIIFDEDGRLVDGQHRLQSIVATDTIIEMLVVRGISRTAFDTIDTGRMRSASDVLSITGEMNTAQLAATARLAYFYENRIMAGVSNPSRKPSHHMLVEFIAKNPNIRDSVQYCSCKQYKVLGAVSPITVAHYICSKVDTVDANYFIDRVGDGVDQKEDSPILQLRDRLLKNKSKREKTPTQDLLALVIKAWNLYRTGKTTRTLAYRYDEDTYPTAR